MRSTVRMNKPIGDKPLSGFSRVALFCSAGATILLTYILSTLSVLLLLATIGFELLLAVALARFGLARLIGNTMGAHIALLTLLLRSFWLRKGAEFRVQLLQADAPALFELLKKLCQKAQVEMPREVSVEMSTNAWVRLKGYRRGAGRTILSLGFDLLAGLSQWEMEGVLAHEITHAKLIQRGYKNWMNRGLGRMGQLARGLHSHVEERRKTGTLVEPAPAMFRLGDRLTRLAARLVAACSRQDEFDADRGASALCGSGAIRSSLLKLGPLSERAARLPWNERVARLQAGEGFSHWLVEELSSTTVKRIDQGKDFFFKYSTHPSLADRLAALPDAVTEEQPDSLPAIGLLARPDQVAETLISRIQTIVAEEERRDSKRLRKWVRKSGIHTHLRPAQSFGVLAMLLGAVLGFGAWVSGGMSMGLACFSLGAILVGLLCFRFGRYRDRLILSVPDFAAMKSAWQTPPNFTPDEVKKLEADLQSRTSGLSSKRKKELTLAIAAYEALGHCDYFRAHIAARLCLLVNNKSIEGAASLAVAGAALGQLQQVHDALRFLQRVSGMATSSMTWCAGWALLLCGDWAPAEAFLEKRCQQKPAYPTVQLLLALCQSKRGKLQSSLLLARRVCGSGSANVEHAKLLIELLLQAGYLREAQELLRKWEPLIGGDIELIMMMVRLNLLRGDFPAADHWIECLRQKQPGAHLSVRLGSLYEMARLKEKASGFYSEALTIGFFPEALIGLARLEAQAQNAAQARKHLVEALNLQRPLGDKAVGPLPLFNQILGQLLALEDPARDCRAWIAHLNGGKSPPGLENKSLLVYATSSQQAEDTLFNLFATMQPSAPPFPRSCIGWTQAGQEQQPDGPVRPGVQGILN